MEILKCASPIHKTVSEFVAKVAPQLSGEGDVAATQPHHSISMVQQTRIAVCFVRAAEPEVGHSLGTPCHVLQGN